MSARRRRLKKRKREAWVLELKEKWDERLGRNGYASTEDLIKGLGLDDAK